MSNRQSNKLFALCTCAWGAITDEHIYTKTSDDNEIESRAEVDEMWEMWDDYSWGVDVYDENVRNILDNDNLT